jgi:hypothetical protein
MPNNTSFVLETQFREILFSINGYLQGAIPIQGVHTRVHKDQFEYNQKRFFYVFLYSILIHPVILEPWQS